MVLCFSPGSWLLDTALPPGRTYTLTDSTGESTLYYRLVRKLADRFLDIITDEVVLRKSIRNASTWKGALRRLSRRERPVRKILRNLDNVLTPFLTGVDEHLRTLSLADRLDPTIRTSRDQYLLYGNEVV
ncbi:MAG: hypothetical protein P1S59_02220 [bacterium]|nr:hypothetical protein [bacterium]